MVTVRTKDDTQSTHAPESVAELNRPPRRRGRAVAATMGDGLRMLSTTEWRGANPTSDNNRVEVKDVDDYPRGKGPI